MMGAVGITLLAFASKATALTLAAAALPTPTVHLAPLPASPPVSLPSFRGSGDGGPKGPSEYQLNLGKAVDALRFSYPTILEREPDDLSIFRPDLTFSGVGPKEVHGLTDYRRMLAGLRMAVGATSTSSEMTYRLVVSGSTIRVRWCCKMWLRDPTSELRSLLQKRAPTPVTIDGVSVYELDDLARIYDHRIENIVTSGGDEVEHPASAVWFREIAATAGAY